MADATLNIKVTLDEEHVATFVSFLSKIEELGASKESELVSLFVGEIAPRFVFGGPHVEIEPVKRSSIGYVFDAG